MLGSDEYAKKRLSQRSGVLKRRRGGRGSCADAPLAPPMCPATQALDLVLEKLSETDADVVDDQ
eukprot:4832959-Pleurochrysis_carterae.AAC.1